MSPVGPNASRPPNASGCRAAMRRPRAATTANSASTAAAPTRPSSSPMTEKMKSVCAAGRKYIFCWPCPRPTPETPPEPKAMRAWQSWNPSPSASRVQSRKELSRRKRYGAITASATRPGAAAAANRARGGGGGEGGGVRQPPAGGEEHQHQDDAAQRGRAEIGLTEAEQRDQPNDQAVRDHPVPELADALAALRQRPRQVEDERELGEL